MIIRMLTAWKSRAPGRPVVNPLVLSVLGLASVVYGVFALFGMWGFIAAGVALLLLEFRVDTAQ